MRERFSPPEEISPVNPEQAAMAENWVAAVHRMIDALPEELRQPLGLSGIEGLAGTALAAVALMRTVVPEPGLPARPAVAVTEPPVQVPPVVPARRIRSTPAADSTRAEEARKSGLRSRA